MSPEVVYRKLPPVQRFKHEPSGLTLYYAPEAKGLSADGVAIEISAGNHILLSDLLRDARKHHKQRRTDEASS